MNTKKVDSINFSSAVIVLLAIITILSFITCVPLAVFRVSGWEFLAVVPVSCILAIYGITMRFGDLGK